MFPTKTIRVLHKLSAKVRRVTGASAAGVVHFAQVIKLGGETIYWADISEVTRIPDDATHFDVRCAVFVQEIENRRAAEAAGR